VETGSSFIDNVRALAAVKVNMRVLHDRFRPDTRASLFGRDLSMPVLGAAVAGAALNYGSVLTEADLAGSMVEGCVREGTVSMTGDGPDMAVLKIGLEAIKAAGGQGIPIIKPLPNKTIIEKIRVAEDHGVMAVGIDVDAAGFLNMVLAGAPVGPKPLDDLLEITASTKLPVILKGIMTPSDAEIAVRAGAAAIVVSNHGGRALDHTPGVAWVLPEIVRVVGGKIAVLADGGVRRGIDVLKYLALGADAVLVGRPLALGAVGARAEGVALTLQAIRSELVRAMILTGSGNVGEITGRVLAQRRLTQQ
jgi:isopentenyl diphosphate isomerase/L-lactate dehydrogenase-like FMN-dependent dehydrogenase